MSKHTPGPWEMHVHQFNMSPFEGALENECGIYPPLGESGPVAIACGEANARLIATTPELIEALKEEHKEKSWLIESESWGLSSDEEMWKHHNASTPECPICALIAKAEAE